MSPGSKGERVGDTVWHVRTVIRKLYVGLKGSYSTINASETEGLDGIEPSTLNDRET